MMNARSKPNESQSNKTNKMNRNYIISESISICDGPMLYFSRILGLAPAATNVTENKISMRWSLLYNIYSYFVATFVVGMGIWGVMTDYYAGDASIRMKDPTGRIVTVADIMFVFFITLLGIYGAPFRIPTAGKYYGILYEIDSVMPLCNIRKVRNQNLKYLIVISIFVSAVFTSDLYSWVRFASMQQDGDFVIKNYLPFYLCYYVVIILPFQFAYGARNIQLRLKKLNEYLQADELEKFRSVVDMNTTHAWSFVDKSLVPNDSLKRNQHLGSVIKLLSKKNQITYNDLIKFKENLFITSSVEFIEQLCRIHTLLCDAVLMLNKAYGLVVLILLISILLHLIETPYFLLLELVGRHDQHFAVTQTVWIGVHILRLLIIVQPCFAASNEAKKTKSKVCNLLNISHRDDGLRNQLQIFSFQLSQRPIEFTACGVCILDRPLIAAISGAVTTYLVILIQLNNDSKKP